MTLINHPLFYRTVYELNPQQPNVQSYEELDLTQGNINGEDLQAASGYQVCDTSNGAFQFNSCYSGCMRDIYYKCESQKLEGYHFAE